MIVNLEVLCRVKLNEAGKQIWNAYLSKLPENFKEEHPQVYTELKNRVDADGYFESALWEVMQLFGPFISQHGTPFEVNTLDLDKNPNFGNYFNQEQVDQ